MCFKWWKSFFAFIIPGMVYAQSITVAVVDLELIGDVSPSVGKAFSEILRTQLTALDEYEVVERAQLEKVLEEQRFASGDSVDESSAAQLGKMVGAHYVITGSIVKSDDDYIINLRFVNVSKGTAELAHSIEMKEGEGLAQACERLVQEISKKAKKGKLESKEKITLSPSKSPDTTKSSDPIESVVKISAAIICLTALILLVAL